MPEDSPALPGLEGFVPKLSSPLLSNHPGKLIEISLERDIYMGIISCPEQGTRISRSQPLSSLTEEQKCWEEAQGLVTAAQLMSQADAVFWGCPEGTFTLLVSDERHADFDAFPRSFSARLNSPGKVCITTSGNIAMALSYPETFSLPVQAGAPSSYHDTLVELAAGNYVVTVTQMFRWSKAQFARTKPGAVHYHIHLQPAADVSPQLTDRIPWLRLPAPTSKPAQGSFVTHD